MAKEESKPEIQIVNIVVSASLGHDIPLEKINIKITQEPEVTIQNMVASGAVGFDLNLNKLAIKLENTEYEPEQFPGLVYKLKAVRATFLLFSNGKVVCTGTKSEQEVKRALDMLIENLKKVK